MSTLQSAKVDVASSNTGQELLEVRQHYFHLVLRKFVQGFPLDSTGQDRPSMGNPPSGIGPVVSIENNDL
jgi:hypothetical protein